MSVEINPPSNGEVTVTMSWREAEILYRLLGHVHSGSLMYNAPNLNEARNELSEHFGGDSAEQCTYFYTQLDTAGGSINIYDKVPF